ncbi:MAG TPA: alpha/beta hydrolase [Candidatus Binataceae bacterium]|nr:alpha/beta hydrolase [Candidatus Binataceae bacterium]
MAEEELSMPYADNHGTKIYYERWGNGGLPIVFLHPWSTNGYIWYYPLFHFARGRACVTLDHRGHGRSDKPLTGYSIQEHAADTAAVMAAAGIDKALVVGNSIGGMIAMQLCLDHPERVAGMLILSSGTALSESMPREAMEAMMRDRDATFSQLLEGTLSARSKRERPEILDLMKSQFQIEANFPRHVFASAAKDPNGVFNWNIKSRLGEIRRPTLIIAGDEDNATPVAANKLLADNIPGARLNVVKEVGHFYQLERPAEFNAALEEFIRSLPH